MKLEKNQVEVPYYYGMAQLYWDGLATNAEFVDNLNRYSKKTENLDYWTTKLEHLYEAENQKTFYIDQAVNGDIRRFYTYQQ